MRRGIQRFIPMIFVIVIIGLLIAAAISIFNLFRGDRQEQTPATDTSSQELLTTTEGRSVRMTVRGQIVSDEEFRSYRVTVAPDERNFTRYTGYLKKPLASKTYENNTRAYEEFVHALDRVGLMAGDPLTGDADTITGVCASGVVYEFEMLRGSTVVKRLWTSSCKGGAGSLKADVGNAQQLFLLQTPDADQLIGKD